MSARMRRPQLPPTTDPRFLDALKEIVEGFAGVRGDRRDRLVSFRDLEDAGIAGGIVQAGGGSGGGGAGTGSGSGGGIGVGPIMTVPPPVRQLAASGGFSFVILTWEMPLYGNHGYTEIARSAIDDISTAIVVGMSSGRAYADAVGGAFEGFWWARNVSSSLVRGPWSESVSAATPEDPAYILEQLEGRIRESELAQDLAEEIQRISGDGAGSVNARLLAEATARSAALLAEAQARTDGLAAIGSALADEAAQRGADVQSVTEAFQAADQSLAQQVDTVTAAIDANAAAVQTEATTRADADAALSARIDTVVATAGDNTAAIQATQQALVDGDSALASQLSTLATTLQGDIDAQAVAIDTLESTVSSQGSAITAQGQAITAILSDLDDVAGDVSAGASATTALDTRVTSAEGAISSQASALTSLEADLRGDIDSKASIQQLADAIADEESARASDISALEADFGSQIGAAIAHTNTAVADEASARAQAISQLESQMGDDSAAIQQLMGVTLGPGGLSAQYMLKTDVNGYVAGFGLYNDGTASQLLIRVDTFAIGSPGKDSLAFAVDGNRVVMDGAFIKHATITDAQIGDVSVDKITGDTAAFVEAFIEDGSITNAKIGQFIQSDNWPTAGWQLHKTLGFQQKSASTGARVERTALGDKIYDQNGTLRFRSGDLSA